MDNKIKIYLPSTTELAHILYFLYKVTDISYWKESVNSLKINADLPCAKDNPWEIVFSHRVGNKISGFGREQTIHFVDQANNTYTIDYSLDNEENLFKGVSLFLESNATLASIGKKIVDFFGGEMFLSNYIEDIKKIHSSSIASFGAVEKFNHNYSYQNALSAVRPLFSENLIEMKEQGFWSESDYSLIYALNPKYHKTYFDMQELSNTLDNKSNTNNNKKIKV